MIITGDDLLVAVYSDFRAEDVAALESEYGINPEARRFTSPLHVSFTSGIFVRDRSHFGFVPSIGRLLARLWWTVKDPGAKILPYRRGVARGLLPIAHTLPILRVWLSKFDGRGVALPSDKGYQFRGAHEDFDDSIWDGLATRYELSRAELEACEKWLEALPADNLFLVHPVLTRIMEVDLADMLERPFEGSGPPH
jgi:hypothetical protein